MTSIEHFSETEYTVIEGPLTELSVERGRVNLLAKVDPLFKANAAASGSAFALGEYGVGSASAMVAMYDGEDTENFICLIDGYPVCGQFSGAAMLMEGAPIKAVVRRQGDILVADGLLAAYRGWCWVPYRQSGKASDKENKETAKQCLLLLLTVIPIFLAGAFGLFSELFIKSLPYYFGVTFGLAAIMYFWTRPTLRRLADPSTEIFRHFGFDEPDNIDLTNFCYWCCNCTPNYLTYSYKGNYSDHYYNDVYFYERARQLGRLRFAGQKKPPTIPEMKQRVVKGVIRELNTQTADFYFKGEHLRDTLRTFSTNREFSKKTFICFIGDQPVCGNFVSAYELREGDYIEAAVCDIHNITVAKAILCEARGLLWVCHNRGPKAERRNRWRFYRKLAAVVAAIMYVICGIAWLAGAHPHMFIATTLAILILGLYEAKKALKHGGHAEHWSSPIAMRAMLALGFSDAHNFNLSPKKYGLKDPSPYRKSEPNYVDTFHYKKALKDGVLKWSSRRKQKS